MDKSWMPKATGILNIISGAIALIGAILLTIIGIVISFIIKHFTDLPIAILPLILFSGIALKLVILGIIDIIGGVQSIQKKRWEWALAGSITAVFSCWPLGVAAILLTALGKSEFKQ